MSKPPRHESTATAAPAAQPSERDQWRTVGEVAEDVLGRLLTIERLLSRLVDEEIGDVTDQELAAVITNMLVPATMVELHKICDVAWSVERARGWSRERDDAAAAAAAEVAQ